ncbi:MAG: ABC transporter ATP-binding protein [Anaerolineae bacterium]|nr:ABC transporter ATP-binding protein [Anaerolineae bacterium]
MADDSLLIVEGVHLIREGTEILHGVNLTVAEAEVHCLLGRNGSGKSTMAYMLMGSGGYLPSGGTVLFGGRDITDATMTERARLGMTLAWQEPARFEGLPVLDYLRLGMAEPSEERVREALEAVALDPAVYRSRNVDASLSGGERKRIELAAVYAMRPRLAILDEPDSGVDVLSLSDIRDLFARMREQGSALLLITHRDEMVEIADRASLICSGEIVMTGEPAHVQAHYCDRCEICDVAREVEEAADYERV